MTILLALDLIGTFVFALSGAIVGVRKRLDLFGVLVIAFAAGNAGGIVRDTLIGSTPPGAISNWRYIVVSMLAGLAIFFYSPFIQRHKNLILMFDGAGLALFAVNGTQKALTFGLNPLAAAMLGMLSGIGGGILRDLLVNEIPTVLKAELYATAALMGAFIVVLGFVLNMPSGYISILGALVCFTIRFLAIRRGWRLPVAAVEKTAEDNEI